MESELTTPIEEIQKAMHEAQDGLAMVRSARRRTAYLMRQQGKSWREIGDALGVTRQRAKQLVQLETKAAPTTTGGT
jgi:hypothetical protein